MFLFSEMKKYRSGGDSSTTYAPSPFYITSKMRSLYLEGYDYLVFDLTKQDRVQIQVTLSLSPFYFGTSADLLVLRTFCRSVSTKKRLENALINSG